MPDPQKLWTSGWLTQLVMIGLATVCLLLNKNDSVQVWVAAAMIVGVMRQLHADRKKEKIDE
jgi:hypothetical protein